MNGVSEVLIEATKIKKVFSGVVAIEGIDFERGKERFTR